MTFSVIIPVLNRATMIGTALDSVRAQSTGDVEILVVDGGSSDGTQDVVASRSDARLIAAPGSTLYAALNIGVAAASASLARDGHDVAAAILTTDTVRKTCAVEVELPPHGGVDARRVRVGGMAKGSGMLRPDMATMLAFVATDAPVDAAVLREMLVRANDASFHEITVDGDTSTNDTVLLLAGPGTENTLTSEDPRLGPLETAITAVMQRRARASVLDGEGRTRVMELVVEGAADRDDARRVAETVACSSLVKTALAGGDPNWGRIVAAAANAGVALEGERLSLDICGMRVFEAGLPTEVDAARLDAAFSDEEVRVVLTLGDGPGRARRWTTDLSAEYVRINSEYTT